MKLSVVHLTLALLLSGCGDPPREGTVPSPYPDGTDPFVDVVVTTVLGAGSGFGENKMPDVILGPPIGRGPEGGSMDVLSLGNEGSIILEFDDLGVVDGEGPDLIVFENAFPSWTETGVVAASEDGVTWHEWPCAATGDEVGCAGLNPVLSNPKNGIEPTDPDAAGGDAYDLADIGIARARFVRIRDSGANTYDGTSGGFDLDAVAVVNWQPIGEW